MSFYIGKDISGNNSLIVTRSSVSESVIKSNIFSSDLVFSSKYPYAVVEYEVFTSPAVSVIGGRYPVARKECVIYLSSSFINTYNASLGTRVLLVFVDGVIIVPRDLYNFPYDLSFKRYYDNIVSDGHIKIVTDHSFAYSKVEVVMLPYTSTFTSISTNLYGGTVSIGNGDIQLNGNSFFKSKFLLGGSVNNVDPVISFFGKSYQIANAGTYIGNLAINCDYNGKTTISSNGKIILDSSSSIYTPIVSDSLSSNYTNYSSNFYNGDFGANSKILAVPSPDVNKFYLISFKIWSHGISEPEYSDPYIIRVGSSGNTVIGYYIIPGEGGGTCIAGVTMYVTSDGMLGFSHKILYCFGQGGPITNIYYGPYNIRVKSRIIG